MTDPNIKRNLAQLRFYIEQHFLYNGLYARMCTFHQNDSRLYKNAQHPFLFPDQIVAVNQPLSSHYYSSISIPSIYSHKRSEIYHLFCNFFSFFYFVAKCQIIKILRFYLYPKSALIENSIAVDVNTFSHRVNASSISA